MHVFRNDIDQALVFTGEADAPDRGRHHLGPTRGDGVEHELAVWIAGRPEEQARAEFAAGNDEGIGHFECSSTALAGTHDLNTVARLKRRLRPSRAWNDGAIDGNRNSALAGVDSFFLQQRGERPRDEWLVLPVDTDARLSSGVCHCDLLHSAAARSDPNRSMLKGRIAG